MQIFRSKSFQTIFINIFKDSDDFRELYDFGSHLSNVKGSSHSLTMMCKLVGLCLLLVNCNLETKYGWVKLVDATDKNIYVGMTSCIY